MSVYIAAPYPTRFQVQMIGSLIEAKGVRVTSTWLREVEASETDRWARIDLADIVEADVFFAYNPEAWKNSGTGGRHVEFGYAWALGKSILLYGVRSNIFHHLSDIIVVEEGGDFMTPLLLMLGRSIDV